MFWGNHAATDGGAVYTFSDLLLRNNDFIGNTAGDKGAGLHNNSSNVTLLNTIAIDHDGPGAEIFHESGMGSVDLDNLLHFDNDIDLSSGSDASLLGNEITLDPGFVFYDPDGDCEDSDLRLSADSPALDQGDGAFDPHLGALTEPCELADVPGDGIDQDCDGLDDCFADGDGDGYGVGLPRPGTTLQCDGPGEAPLSGDCDDADATVHPGQIEVPADGIDQDCDGLESCYPDDDLDGFGTDTPTAASEVLTCLAPGVSNNTGDCDDANGSVNPGAVEVCDDIDNDCDGQADLVCNDTAYEPPPAGCDCNHAPPGVPILLLGVLGLAQRRR